MDDSSKLFVGGLPRNATELDITAYFSRFGKVKGVEMRKTQLGTPRGFAFVEMQSPLIAEHIIGIPSHSLAGQPIDVKRMVRQKKENMIFVGGLSRNTSNEMLRIYFMNYGTVLDAKVRTDGVGNSRGFGFVTFENSDTVEAVSGMDNLEIDGKKVEAKPTFKSAKEKQEAMANSKSAGVGSPSKIFVGGLDSVATTEESLSRYFSEFGTVTSAVIKHDPATQKSRGFGFVGFADSDSLDAVMNSRPHNVDGRDVDIRRLIPNAKPEDLITVKSLFVGGLKATHNEQNIREHFQQFGNVVKINIPKRVADGEAATGHRGFCFIEFDDYDAVDKAILEKSHVIDGMDVDVKKGLSKDEKVKVEQTKRERELRELRSAANVTNGTAASLAASQTLTGTYPADGYGGYTTYVSKAQTAGSSMGSTVLGHMVDSVVGMGSSIGLTASYIDEPTVIVKSNVIKGLQFRAILMRSDVSAKALNILETENLLDSSVLLSLTTEEFKELPISLGDRKRIENALRENFSGGR